MPLFDSASDFFPGDLHEDQMVGDAIYYRDEDKIIVRADADGARKLSGIPAESLSVFKVSPDETMIAWTSNLWDQTPPQSELWIASLDGSNARKVATSTRDASSELFVPTPYRWTDDGSDPTQLATGSYVVGMIANK